MYHKASQHRVKNKIKTEFLSLHHTTGDGTGQRFHEHPDWELVRQQEQPVIFKGSLPTTLFHLYVSWKCLFFICLK